MNVFRFLMPLVLLAMMNTVFANEQKIVSVGGALTEILYGLGVEDRIVGVDTTSIYPQAATEFPQVGYQRTLSAEGVLSLSPTDILMTDQAGPPAVIEQLEATGVMIHKFPVEYSAEGLAKTIKGIASVVGEETRGAEIIKAMQEKMQAVNASISKNNQSAPKVIFLLNVGKGSPMAAGINTAANAMIKLSGGENVMTGYEGYKPISTEALIAANPDVLLLTNRTLEGIGGLEKAYTMPGIALTNAGKNKNVLAMDGLYLLGFTPRLPDAVQELHQLLFKQN